jgi:hypothetical protein
MSSFSSSAANVTSLSHSLSNTSDISSASNAPEPQLLSPKSKTGNRSKSSSNGNSSSRSQRSMKRQTSSQEEEIDLTELQRGSLFLKFGRKGPVHERLVRLSKNCRYITWDGSWIRMKSNEERSGL